MPAPRRNVLKPPARRIRRGSRLIWPARIDPVALTRVDLLNQTTGFAFGTGAFTTNAFTPPSNSLLVVVGVVMESGGSTDPVADLTVSGGGLTWTSRAQVGTATAWSMAMRIWTAPVTTGASMTLALDLAARDAAWYAVSAVAYTGYDTGIPTGGTGTFVDTATPDGAQTITLSSAPAATSEVVAGVAMDKETVGVTPGAGWTEIADLQLIDTGGLETEARTGSTSTSVDWTDVHTGTGSIFKALGVALEIKAAPGGASTNAPAGLASGAGSAPDALVDIDVNAEAATGAGAAGAAATRADPIGKTGVLAWLDASQLTGLSDGAAVASWTDVSGNAAHAVQATGGNQPTYQTAEVNGRPVIRFDGSDQLVATFAGSQAQPNAVAIVVRHGTSVTGPQYLLDGLDTSNRHGLFINAIGQLEAFAGASIIGTGPTAGEVVIYTWNVNGASSVLYRNGVSHASGDVGAQALGGLSVGARFNTIEFLDGDVCEVVAYDTALSAGELTAWQTYAAAKWVAAGTTAPAGAASGSGAASAAQAAAGVNAEAATGTGVALAPTPAVTVNAEAASGTGAAFDATVSTVNATSAPAGLASGTGTATDAVASVGVNAEAATGFGDAAVATQVDATSDAGLASGTGAAPDATVATTTPGTGPAGLASGTGQALDPTTAVTVGAEVASGTGTAPDAIQAVGAASEAASGAGAAHSPAIDIRANADQAAGTGGAFDATVSTLALTNAPADVAVGTGQAPDASVAAGINADQATGTGSAPQPTVATGIDAPAGLASGAGAANDPAIALGVPAEPATATGQAPAATGQVARDAPAGLASSTGVAADAAVAVAGPAGLASGTGQALDATVPPPVPPPRWLEGALTAANVIDGSTAGGSQIEGALVGAGQIEGSMGV
jgi:hypothetical protein